MFFLYVKCRNWRDSHWDFPCCRGVLQPTLQVHPRASSTVISSSLWSCVTSSLSPCPPPDPGIFLISDTPHLTPPWSHSVSSRSWTNRQVCQEMQEGNLGLSQCAGYQRVALKKCIWEQSKSSQAGDKWRLGWVSSLGPAVLWIWGKDENSENSGAGALKAERGAWDWEMWKESYFFWYAFGDFELASSARKGFLEFFDRFYTQKGILWHWIQCTHGISLCSEAALWQTSSKM